MPVLGVPHIVVLEPVHVGVPAIGITVHIHHETCQPPSEPLSFEFFEFLRLNRIWDIKVLQRRAPASIFFKNIPHALSDKNSPARLSHTNC